MTEGLAGAALAEQLSTAPLPVRPGPARDRVADWRAGLEAAHALHRSWPLPFVEPLLQAVADHSPYLWRLVVADPDRLAAILATEPTAFLQGCLSTMEGRCREPGATQDDVMRALRRAKAEVALAVALADLGGVWDVDRVTAALTAFADRAVAEGLRFLLGQAHGSGKLHLPDPANPEASCGLVVLALGKQGSRELNYSSDIDIVAFYDPSAAAVPPGAAPGPLYVRLVQTLAKLLSERTADGYVLRVDLRLRPDPGSTAVAIGLPSAFSYYESYGQNWERAALIKARPVAGDRALGHAFLVDLAPFIWRKYFDFAAIADIHAMKRQIHAVRGHAAIAVAGHDIKLGRGGIREIEFFVQTQQLIFGGRRPPLRGARTLDMLAALCRDGWVGAAAVAELSAAYLFLRGVEHRLQMVDDEQTHRLPSAPEALEAFARFAGYDGEAAFAGAFTRHARAVEAHYAKLFEHAPGLDADGGNLVFTGVENDPETIATLRGLGFLRPEAAAEAVRGWHFGRRSAVRSPRAREALTELVPRLLAVFGRSGDPDGALAGFDSMLGRMPAASELFALLRSNTPLLDLFGDILGVAPRLAATIAARPHILDAAVDPASLASVDDADKLEARVRAVLDPRLPSEEFLDRSRDLAQEELFLIGVRLLGGAATPQRAGEAYADLAAMIVRAALAHCEAVFAQVHGAVPGGACVVVAMGKLGSREMTASSDLDLILIYDAEPQAESTGPRPLDAARYYARLTQRLIGALTVATRRGLLYAVDMRLRPSGGQGPLAARFSSFVAYQDDEAATWEHMALTRARVIAGDPALGARVTAAVTRILTRPRSATAVRRDAAAMRALIAKEKGETDRWDIKLAAGGLLDLDFIAQTLVLCHAAAAPDLLAPASRAVIERAIRVGVLDGEVGGKLLEAYDFLSGLQHIARLTTAGRFDPATAGTGVRRRMVQAVNLPVFASVEAELSRTQRQVRAAFDGLIGTPGAAPR